MKDGGSGVCSTMQVRLMSLPLLMYSSELPRIFAFDTVRVEIFIRVEIALALLKYKARELPSFLTR